MELWNRFDPGVDSVTVPDGALHSVAILGREA